MDLIWKWTSGSEPKRTLNAIERDSKEGASLSRHRQSAADSTEIIEEAPAPGLSAKLKKDLAKKAVAAAKAVN